MKMETGKVYHGFRLLEERKVAEVNSVARLFEHEVSGARLLHLENDDDNKVFSIAFRTLPADNTGLPHILEHSVLCGSRKFPVKEPFVELVKGSVKTFLNAMTFPDKTVYPVASRNATDFHNLMDVYLDAVFYPRAAKEPIIMMQEGWHYEIDPKTGDLIYNGVVYNEMKGYYSSPETLLTVATQAALFPDTIYGFESGGDPDAITDLTFEQFAAFYRRYYHPSNSYLYLYGDMDLDQCLRFIDQEYLSAYRRKANLSSLSLQPPFPRTVVREDFYPISPGERTDGKTLLSLNFVVGMATDPELYLAFQVLSHFLTDTPASPLKVALAEAGIGKETFGSFSKASLQMVLTVGVKGAEPEDRDRFLAVVYRTLQKLVIDGIDKKAIEASINTCEFELREADGTGLPKGLIYNIRCLDSWLYDAHPLLHLEYNQTLARIKEGAQGRYFESLIEQRLMDNTHRALVVLRPQAGLLESKAAEQRQKLAAEKERLGQAALQDLAAQTADLKRWQETPDSPAALAKIPLLNLSDLRPTAEQLPLIAEAVHAVPVLFHPQFTNNISYLHLYFDTSAVPQADLPYLHLLSWVLGKVSTLDRGYTALANAINLSTGGITYQSRAFSAAADDAVFKPKFVVKGKALSHRLPELAALLAEILGRSRFDDHRRLRELVREARSVWETTLLNNGHEVASGRALGYFSPVGWYTESRLLPFYQFLVQIEQNFDRQAEEIAERLADTARRVFTRNNCLASFADDEASWDRAIGEIDAILSSLGVDRRPPASFEFAFDRRNEGLMTSSKVQYVAQVANFRRLGRERREYCGSMRVLQTLLGYEYLWNKVRVQGGAYGCFARFDRNGNMVFVSYRDPGLRETLEVYAGMPGFLRRLDLSSREMTKFIIGTIGQMDAPLTPAAKAERATEYYLRNITQADLQRERDEVMATSLAELKGYASLLEEALAQNYICVLGGEARIRQNRDLFANLVQIVV